MCEVAYNIIVSIFAFTIGLVYLILSLIPTIPPPNSFLVHWKNHKDFWAEGLDLNVIPNQIITTNIKNDIVSYPHPSAWHPASCSKMTAISRQSSAFLTPIYNTDYTQYQQQLPPQDTNHLCVY